MSDNVNPVERIWFEIRNMPGENQCWEWMEAAPDGEYLPRLAVLAIIEKFLPGDRDHESIGRLPDHISE
jgi:hypothetical protein